MLKRLRSFLKEYRNLSFVGLAMIVGGILDFTAYDTAAHWVLGSAALAATIPLVWAMIETFRSGLYGVDILAVTAIGTSLLLHQYWAAIVIVLMLVGGETLERYAESRAKTELTTLLTHKPKKARLLKGTRTMSITVHSITKGDKLEVRPGDVMPVDAVIIEGESSFDESSLTGESLLVHKTIGQEVMSGAINVDGNVTVRALRAASESQYEQIVKLVKSASARQSPFVRLADRYSMPFTLVSFIIAGSAWLISGEAVRFLEVLVVATPCPLLLGAPIALISGMSRAAKYGIIVKTGSAFEKLAEAQTIAFDKTGTLTLGQPSVSSVLTYNGYSEKDVLVNAAMIEQSSNHILAAAIVTAAQEHMDAAKLVKAKQVKETAGRGLTGRIGGKTVLVGRLTFLEDNNVSVPKEFNEARVRRTATFVAINGNLAGAITFKDSIRPETPAMLMQLRRTGIKHFAMVTGDNTASAVAVAKEIDITDVYPDCLPGDKLAVIDQLRHRPVVFVGDGVNDAPVLTAADVGIALGARGSTAASETADVVIMLDDVSRVATAVTIAKHTFSIARQSILAGIMISLVLMGIFATGKFRPVYGAAVQELIDVAVILNALRAHGPWKTKRRPKQPSSVVAPVIS